MENEKIKGIIKSNKKGFAFFIAEEKDIEDIFISKDNLNGALDEDYVEVEIIKEAGKDSKKEGRVVKIVERNDLPLVGTFEKVKSFGFVILDDKSYSHDLFISQSHVNKAKDGDKVLVKILDFNEEDKNPRGEVLEVLGKKGDIGIDILSIAKEFQLPDKFSRKNIQYASSLGNNLKREDYNNRVDFRDLLTFTIDGEDSKDLDDAISIIYSKGIYTLYVHIADVSHYVKEGSPTDKDAYERGNSVYLLDRVIPMLPKEISNGICSLNPNIDRLAVTVEMKLDKDAKIIDYNFYESVINSDFRLVYDEVTSYLSGDTNVYKDEKLKEALEWSYKLSELIDKKRKLKGSIDFNFKETKIILDKYGRPIYIGVLENGLANKIIENFMVTTNETVGGHFANMEVEFLYRAHDKPTEEKTEEFKKLISRFGFIIKGKELHAKDFQNILNKVDGKKEEVLINNLMLRTMQKAEYRREASIHFGLASENYSHFTAPIRRYSDLLVHRILKNSLEGKFKKETQAYLDYLDKLAEHVSMRERKAEEAEREVVSLKEAEYMQDKVGCEYDGIIISLTNFGIFIQLENTIEGLVHFRNLKDDYYEFDEDNYVIIGQRNKKSYKLGQKVRIRVESVNVDMREIDFGLVENETK